MIILPDFATDAQLPISSLQPGILNKILMYISQHKHLVRGKGSQLTSSSKLQQQLKVIDQKGKWNCL